MAARAADERHDEQVVESTGPTVLDLTELEVPRWRDPTTRVLAGLLALAFGGVFFGIPSLFLALADSSQDLHELHGVGWGVLAGVLLAGGFMLTAIQPRRWVAGTQVGLIALVAFVLGAAIGGSAPVFAAPFVLAALVLAWVHPAREGLLRAGRAARPALAIAVLGAIPLGWYALSQAALSRGATGSDPHVLDGENHYEGMAAVGIALALTAVLGAMRPRGWRFAVIAAALGVAYMGIASIISEAAGSWGAGWGVVAVIGAIAYLGAALAGDPADERARSSVDVPLT